MLLRLRASKASDLVAAEERVTGNMGGGQQRQRLRLLSAELPDELMEEVLVRLPAKQLLGFKRVCVAWNSLISSPRFVQRHAKLTNRRHQGRDKQQDVDLDRAKLILNQHHCDMKSCSLRSIIDYNFDGHVPTLFTLPLPPPQSCMFGSILIGSCNGLLCAQFRYGVLVAWNPITGVYRELPRGTFWGNYFEEQSPHKTFGFGYDESTDDYKLVSIYGPSRSAGVFSFKGNSWRKLRLPFPGDRFLPWEPAAFVGGTLNWCAKSSKQLSSTSWAIVSFNLATEKFRVFRLPRKISDCFGSPEQNVCATVTALQGRLCLFVYNAPSYVWIMKDYGVALSSAWTLVATIPYAPSPDHKIWMPRPLYLFRDVAALLVGGDETVRFDVFNLRRKSLSHPWIRGANARFTFASASQAVIHLDTLVSPYGNGTPADTNSL